MFGKFLVRSDSYLWTLPVSVAFINQRLHALAKGSRLCSRETATLLEWMTCISIPSLASHRASQKPSRPADGITEAGLDGDAPRAGQGGSPSLTLDGFAGPLDHLLSLARAQTIDLAGIEPRRVCRRLFGLSHAAMTRSLAWA